jgi:phospholipase/lecithinase/hemolysin
LVFIDRVTVQTVYETGGRKFLLYNTGPFGCLPSTLSRRGIVGELDGAGCLVRHNAAAEALNARLRLLRRDLAAELPGATVVGVDMYAIKYGIVANHTAHGFSSPLMACCGAGGPPYNYEPGAACGTAKAKACPEADGEWYISWDGVHYTEAANQIVADKILSSEYSTPRLPLQTLCDQST